MYTLMVVIFILGYVMIAFEHPLKIDKAAPAPLIAVLGWTAYVIGAADILPSNPEYIAYLSTHANATYSQFIGQQLSHHLGDHAEILFFLMGAMTIVELIDSHEGFEVITKRIKTNNRVKLFWIVGVLTFFLSATLDNLTTSIVMISLLRKLIGDKKERWFFAGLVIISANAGGAWSPIGDVTTTMLWIGGQITAGHIVSELFMPSLVCLLVPLVFLSFTHKGIVHRPERIKSSQHIMDVTTPFERQLVLILGISLLLFVPIFKTTTHLPPYMGMMFGLGVLWVVTEILHKNKKHEIKSELSVIGVLQKIDLVSILFFLGILLAISSLQSAGQLSEVAHALDKYIGNIYAINIIIGFLSAVVDNVPLVAASMGMYPIEVIQNVPISEMSYAQYFVQDGHFWELLAYCAGTGGSSLIIGSAAGVAVMGMERIDFIWYLKKMSLLAILGYMAGVGYYMLFVA